MSFGNSNTKNFTVPPCSGVASATTNAYGCQFPNIKGISTKKPYPAIGSSSHGRTRRILREAWNGGNSAAAESALQGKNNCINQRSFRAAMNAGDLMSRKNYSCGGPDMIGSGNPGSNKMTTKDGGQSKRNCNESKKGCPNGEEVPPATCNVKYVYDSSNYTRYLKERADNRGYTSVIGGKTGKYGNNQMIPLGNWRKNIGFDYSVGGANNGAFTTFNRVRH